MPWVRALVTMPSLTFLGSGAERSEHRDKERSVTHAKFYQWSVSHGMRDPAEVRDSRGRHVATEEIFSFGGRRQRFSSGAGLEVCYKVNMC